MSFGAGGSTDRRRPWPPEEASSRSDEWSATTFDLLYQLYKPLIEDELHRRRGLSLVDAEDAAQTVFFRLWQSGLWRDIDAPEPYFKRAASLAACEFLRRRAYADIQISAGSSVPDPRPSPVDEMIYKQRRATLLRVFEKLPPRCSEVMRLK